MIDRLQATYPLVCSGIATACAQLDPRSLGESLQQVVQLPPGDHRCLCRAGPCSGL